MLLKKLLSFLSLCSSTITSGTITLDTMSYVGVEETIRDEGEFLVYPNPVSYNLTIEISAPSEKKYLSIYNVLGEKIIKPEIHPRVLGAKSEINVSSLAAGIYVAEVRIGQSILRKKFIKE